ncbi:MAG: hypothetical protein ACRDJL_11730 [Actinomycetota bacterium]
MKDLTERELDGLLLGLGGQLEASERRAEEEAADDLALSLAQDASLADALCRSGAVNALAPDGGRFRVAAVGADFLWIETPHSRLLPLGHSVVTLGERDRPPVRWNLSLLEACRDLSRSGGIVELTHQFGSVTGRVERAARDFISIVSKRERTAVPYTALRAIRIIRGDLADVS